MQWPGLWGIQVKASSMLCVVFWGGVRFPTTIKRHAFVSGEGHEGALLSVINGWQGLLFSGLWISCLALSAVAASH